MAIQYLDTKRIRGSSTAGKTPTFSTTFGSTSGWTSNDTHVFIDTANNMLEFELDDDNTDEFISYDMGAGNISNTEWVLRCEITFNTWNGQTNDNNNMICIGCYDNGDPNGINPSGDYLAWGWYMRGNTSTDGFDTKMRSSNNGTVTENEGSNNPFSSSTATATPFYLELKRVSADSLEFRCFSDSSYSTQVGSTLTRSTSDAVTALRHITIQLFCQGTIAGGGYTGYIQNLKFYNDTTSATQDDKATLITALTSKTDNMTTDLGWTANSTPSGQGYDATNDRVIFKGINTSSDASESPRIYMDMQDADFLGGNATTGAVNLDDTAFTAKFELRLTTYTPASSGENRNYIGFSSTTTWGGIAANTFHLEIVGEGSVNKYWRVVVGVGELHEGVSGSYKSAHFATDAAVDTTYYITFTKTGGNVHAIRITTSSDYTGGEQLSITRTGCDDLRYFGVKGRGDTQGATGGDTTGYIDNLYIKSGTYNDKDNLTDVVAGTRFDELTTKKSYRLDDSDVGTSMPSAATGGTITTDGNYKVHTFEDSGTFTVTARASAAPMKILVVAGGGGGGKANGGSNNHWQAGSGGGAGGFRLIDKTTLATGTDTFAVVVGAFGRGHHHHGNPQSATAGGASTFATGTADAIDATGGGHGGTGGCNGTTGGSGGGRGSMAGNIGGYSPVEGYAGGTNTGGCWGGSGTHGGGGGGGGAAATGSNGSGDDGGIGGAGRGTDIVTSGTTLYYAGGGSGSNGEHGGSNAAATLGGGGAGGGSNASASGSNAGYGSGGGGGSGEYGQAGRGFDGVVIIRYKFQNFKEWKGKGVA